MAVQSPQGYAPEDLQLRSLIARHKLATLGSLAVVVILLAMLLLTVLGPKAGAVTDQTSCSQWGSSSQTKQAAYARLYVREHGSLASGATSVSAVETAINNGCMAAFGSDEEDKVSVLQSIRKLY